MPQNCSNCWHHQDNDCALYSCACIEAVVAKADCPPRWMSIEEGLEIAMRLADKKIKKEIKQ